MKRLHAKKEVRRMTNHEHDGCVRNAMHPWKHVFLLASLFLTGGLCAAICLQDRLMVRLGWHPLAAFLAPGAAAQVLLAVSSHALLRRWKKRLAKRL
jgi:hypothetical protein